MTYQNSEVRTGLISDSMVNLKTNTPELNNLPYNVDWKEMKTLDESTGEMVFIDFSNAHHSTFNQIAAIIKEAYDEYDGFVVVYGTDTMAWLGGCLSYMLEGLNKPIVCTGSMEPTCDRERQKTKGEIEKYRITKENDKFGSDGPRNLIDSIHLAAKAGNEIPQIPEVVCCFYGRIIRGNTLKKYSSHDRDAFRTLSMTQIGSVRHGGENEIDVEKNGLPPVFTSECQISMSSVAPLPVRNTDLVVHKINPGINIAEYEVCSMLSEKGRLAAIGEADAIILHSVPTEPIEFNNHFIRPIEDIRKGRPIFYLGDNPPIKDWISVKASSLAQAKIKVEYILSRTRDPNEIKLLAEGNLRGENDREFAYEEDVIRESEHHNELTSGQKRK